MRTPFALAALALLAVVLPVPAQARGIVGETCQGLPATIVQSEGVVRGTAGDDVIVGGQATRVRAGRGDDTICVAGGRVQGGRGTDSVEMRGTVDDDSLFLVAVERVDVGTGQGRDSVYLEWNDRRGQHALEGRIGGGADEDFISVEGAREINVNLSRERLRIGRGTSVDLSGFEGAFATAWRRGRVVGGAGDNLLGAGGCFAYVVGGPGDDDISWRPDGVPHRCPGLRAKGQGGNDILRGSYRDDYLSGGSGRDRAYGGRGLNRCHRVELKRSCS